MHSPQPRDYDDADDDDDDDNDEMNLRRIRHESTNTNLQFVDSSVLWLAHARAYSGSHLRLLHPPLELRRQPADLFNLDIAH